MNIENWHAILHLFIGHKTAMSIFSTSVCGTQIGQVHIWHICSWDTNRPCAFRHICLWDTNRPCQFLACLFMEHKQAKSIFGSPVHRTQTGHVYFFDTPIHGTQTDHVNFDHIYSQEPNWPCQFSAYLFMGHSQAMSIFGTGVFFFNQLLYTKTIKK